MTYKTRESELTSKREYMRRQRRDNPEKIARWNALRRAAWSETKQRREPYLAKLKRDHFFRWRALRVSKYGISARDLAALWKSQRGHCALSGRKLDRHAQLDHVVALARGGTHELGNFQWLCKEVNLAKRELSVDEFVALCRDIVATCPSSSGSSKGSTR